MQNKDFKQGVIQDMSAHISALMFQICMRCNCSINMHKARLALSYYMRRAQRYSSLTVSAIKRVIETGWILGLGKALGVFSSFLGIGHVVNIQIIQVYIWNSLQKCWVWL